MPETAQLTSMFSELASTSPTPATTCSKLDVGGAEGGTVGSRLGRVRATEIIARIAATEATIGRTVLFMTESPVRRLNRRGVVNAKVIRKWNSDPHRPRVMRSRSQGRRRSVDRGTCGPGIQPRKFLPPGRRRCRRKRKAPSGAPISRGVPESRAVRDPEHVRRHLAWEPGDPKSAQGRSSPGTRREV